MRPTHASLTTLAIAFLASTLGLSAQRLDLPAALAGLGTLDRSSGPAARIVSISPAGAALPQGGRLFHLQAELPKNRLATIERYDGAGNWVVAEDELLSTDGTAEFHVWGDDPKGLFRLKTRPFPQVNLTPDAALLLDEPIHQDVLSQFLRRGVGMQINPPPSGQSPGWIGGGAPVPLSQLGVLGVLNGSNPTTESFDGGGLDGLKQLYARPRLSLIHPGSEVLTSASAVIGESLKVPLAWKVSRQGVKRARYVIQRVPFSTTNSYSQPPAKSIVGWVDNPNYPDNSTQVSFWMDFAKQGIYGIEAPQPFFVRIYEEDASGNIIGWPSNTFSFVVREKEIQWPVPDGDLQFRLKRIKCYKTTTEWNSDEVHWVVLRFRFLANQVLVDEVSNGIRSFDDGDGHWPGHLLWNWSGPSQFPDTANTWYVLCLREYDAHVTPEATFYKEALQDMAFLATGGLQSGWSQQQVMNHVLDHYDAFRWWFHHIGSERIGYQVFRVTDETMAHAVAHGKKRISLAMGGDGNLAGNGSSYGAWIDLDFYPH